MSFSVTTRQHVCRAKSLLSPIKYVLEVMNVYLAQQQDVYGAALVRHPADKKSFHRFLKAPVHMVC